MSSIRRVILVGMCPLMAIFAASSQAATPAQIIRALNQQRTENGIPAGIVQNHTWSHDCALHDRWMLKNGISHYEQPGTPGYTNGGAWAGPRSVLALGGSGFDFTVPATDPYLSAPFHLSQILNPRLQAMGAAELGPSDCETTYPGYRRRAHRNTIYTYPGSGATSLWFETARELPGVPGDSLGLPQGTTTGPNMIVFANGPNRQYVRFQLKSASLRGPGGHKIPTRWLDQSGSAQGGVGFVIPVSPLKPGTMYTARATFARTDFSGTRIHKRTFSKTWTFTTTPLLTGAAAVNFTLTPHGQALVAHATPLDLAYDGRFATFRETIRYGGSIVATSTATAVIGRDYISYDAPGPGEELDFVLDVHRFKVGTTRVQPFTLGPLTFSG